MNSDEDNMIDPAMMLVVGSNDRTYGASGDSSIPDPLHSNCVITFHCTRDPATNKQTCTSSSSCGSNHGILAARQ